VFNEKEVSQDGCEADCDRYDSAAAIRQRYDDRHERQHQALANRSRPWQAQGRERSVNKDDAGLDDRQGCQARVPDPLPPGMQLHPRGAATAEALILIGACPSVDAVAV
jgi:hypothetical protein